VLVGSDGLLMPVQQLRPFLSLLIPPYLSSIFNSWGCVFSTFYVFLLSFAVSFLLVWEPTKPVVLFILSQIIAIAITLGVKNLILMGVRKMLFKGMYRVHPASSNFMMVILEVSLADVLRQ